MAPPALAFSFGWPEAVTTILVVFLVVVLLLALLTSPSRTRVGFFIERERIDPTPPLNPSPWEETTQERIVLPDKGGEK